MVSYARRTFVWVYTPVRKVGLSEKTLKRRCISDRTGARRLSAVTYEVQILILLHEKKTKQKLSHVIAACNRKRNMIPPRQMETEIFLPKSYKGPITRSRIKTLEQNDSGGALSSFEGSNATRIICYKSR
ncbi:hypothetical protein TNCV_337061 [Trichonephila clavipes]|nr:hypothetical protein TNCV_337061 [Trichonephila clavipes]